MPGTNRTCRSGCAWPAGEGGGDVEAARIGAGANAGGNQEGGDARCFATPALRCSRLVALDAARRHAVACTLARRRGSQRPCAGWAQPRPRGASSGPRKLKPAGRGRTCGAHEGAAVAARGREAAPALQQVGRDGALADLALGAVDVVCDGARQRGRNRCVGSARAGFLGECLLKTGTGAASVMGCTRQAAPLSTRRVPALVVRRRHNTSWPAPGEAQHPGHTEACLLRGPAPYATPTWPPAQNAGPTAESRWLHHAETNVQAQAPHCQRPHPPLRPMPSYEKPSRKTTFTSNISDELDRLRPHPTLRLMPSCKKSRRKTN